MADTNRYNYFNTKGQVERATGFDELQKVLREKNEATLRMEVQRQVRNTDWQVHMASTFAQMELDRRTAEETRSFQKLLARKTTLWSGGMGIVGAIVGGLIGAVVTHLGS